MFSPSKAENTSLTNLRDDLDIQTSSYIPSISAGSCIKSKRDLGWEPYSKSLVQLMRQKQIHRPSQYHNISCVAKCSCPLSLLEAQFPSMRCFLLGIHCCGVGRMTVLRSFRQMLSLLSCLLAIDDRKRSGLKLKLLLRGP